ncbi:PSP1 domain protein [Seminavis robusta]|uniref:PSP1 domain protein n=1 Tax=Seminavis robusta TaxID=568900 RepID=A0A9N8ED48_9STRA|nr:PSP1 domain protein [Seminavis robusta]|eukprot:Sro827_g207830.1 PSP1 domain protein (893) ;mRNA; f:21977-25366
MATSAPPHIAAGWVNSTSGNQDAGQKELELKMSGMSLMSNYNNNGGPPGMSASTVSTTSADDAGRHAHDSSIDHSAAGSFKGSTPSSPSPEVIGHLDNTKLSRPPGLGVASPVVGGAGHSKNSSATSPMLTLTPNSSVDGNSDMYSLGGGRQQSPFQGDQGPTMPFLRNDGRRNDENGDYNAALSNFGSFDLAENDNDGLLGLDALRDRSYSSPGPMARSFESAPSLRGGLPPPRDAGSEGRRRRGVSRDNSGRSAGSARPPLASVNSSQSPRAGDLVPSGGDLSLGGLVVPFPHGVGNGRRSGDPSPTRPTQDPDYRGFGTIGHAEFSGAAKEWEPTNRRRSIAGPVSESLSRPEYGRYNDERPQHQYEPSRRRSIGTESGREFYHQQQQQQQQHHHSSHGNHNDHGLGYGHSEHGQTLSDHSVAHKFGSLPSLGSHMQQQKQRMPQSHQQPYNPMMIPQPKHTRSLSQPGPSRNGPSPDHMGMEGGSVGRYNAPLDHNSEHYSREPPRYIGAPPQGAHHRTHSGDSFRSAHSRRSASMSHGSLSNNSYDGVGMPAQKRNSQPNLGTAGGYYGQAALPSIHSMPRMDKGDVYDPNGHQRRHTYEDDLTLLGEHIEVPADHGMDDGYGSYGMPADRMRAQIAPPEAMTAHYSGFEGQPIHHHLPTAGAALPSPKVVYNVKFKRTQRSFVLGPRIPRNLEVGTYVKVEADRGEDLGIVIGKVAADKYNFSARSAYRSHSMGGISDLMPTPNGLSPPGTTDLKCIIRLATHDEVSLLAIKRDEEEELLKICRTKVRQRGLPMNVVDAEYQFDRHKLTFFFEAEGRIDFRELVRDLFSMYKTRIWMQQLDKNMTPAGTPGVSPPPPSMIDYGTPIIAPVSEFSDAYAMNGLAGGS